MRHCLRLKSSSSLLLALNALAFFLTNSIAVPAIAGEIRANRYASDAEQTSSPTDSNANGVDRVGTRPSVEEIAAVEIGLDLARSLIPDEHFGQKRAFENRDVAKINRITASINMIQQSCVVIGKYGAPRLLPHLSFENQVFIADDGISLQLQPYLTRTASSAQAYSEKLAEEEKSRERHASAVRATRYAGKSRDPITDYQPEKLVRELKSIERELRASQLRGEQPRQEHLDRLEEINQINKQKIGSINRRAGQPGYTLSQRRAAAMTLLMRRGYTNAEAVLTVQSMESLGLLPDPPKK